MTCGGALPISCPAAWPYASMLLAPTTIPIPFLPAVHKLCALSTLKEVQQTGFTAYVPRQTFWNLSIGTYQPKKNKFFGTIRFAALPWFASVLYVLQPCNLSFSCMHEKIEFSK